MRVSRTRFSKRRIKRKTEFPIVAVVQKKRKVESIKSLTFGILNNQSSYARTNQRFVKGQDVQSTYEPGFTNQGSKYEPSSLQPFTENRLPSSDASLNESKTMNELSGNTERTKSKATQKNIDTKRSFVTPQKKSRATIDYKNVILLRNLITAEGKILPRRINKLTAKQQRYVQKAIKSARIMGLIPFINKSRPF